MHYISHFSRIHIFVRDCGPNVMTNLQSTGLHTLAKTGDNLNCQDPLYPTLPCINIKSEILVAQKKLKHEPRITTGLPKDWRE